MSIDQPKPLFSWRKYWAKRFGIAPFLPMSRAEMESLGWDSCDVILVTGDAYVDHPSFGMALIGRLLEAQGFRVGIIAQPDWHSARAFKVLGRPNLFFGVTSGNMDSMVNRYTSDRKIRSDDAYTPNAEPNRRPDRALLVYAQRCREAWPEANVVLGSIEASLRRIAHYDYWSDKVRRSVLPDAKADLLIYGNAERALIELAHRLAAGEAIGTIRDLRGTAFMTPHRCLPGEQWIELDSSQVDTPGPLQAHANPYAPDRGVAGEAKPVSVIRLVPPPAQALTIKVSGVKRFAALTAADAPLLYRYEDALFYYVLSEFYQYAGDEDGRKAALADAKAHRSAADEFEAKVVAADEVNVPLESMSHG